MRPGRAAVAWRWPSRCWRRRRRTPGRPGRPRRSWSRTRRCPARPRCGAAPAYRYRCQRSPWSGSRRRRPWCPPRGRGRGPAGAARAARRAALARPTDRSALMLASPFRGCGCGCHRPSFCGTGACAHPGSASRACVKGGYQDACLLAEPARLLAVPGPLVACRCGLSFGDFRPHDLLRFASGQATPGHLTRAQAGGRTGEVRAARRRGRRARGTAPALSSAARAERSADAATLSRARMASRSAWRSRSPIASLPTLVTLWVTRRVSRRGGKAEGSRGARTRPTAAPGRWPRCPAPRRPRRTGRPGSCSGHRRRAGTRRPGRACQVRVQSSVR